MTCLERLQAEYPDTWKQLMNTRCPSQLGYTRSSAKCPENDYRFYCEKCWEKESD